MRVIDSIGMTTILPSPIAPVWPLLAIMSTASSTWSAPSKQLDLELGDEIDLVFGAAIDLLMAALAAKAFDLVDGQPADAELGQRFLDFFQFERLDDAFDLA